MAAQHIKYICFDIDYDNDIEDLYVCTSEKEAKEFMYHIKIVVPHIRPNFGRLLGTLTVK